MAARIKVNAEADAKGLQPGGEHMENFNPTEKRLSLFSQLDYALSLAREKSGKEKAKNTERMSWVRILVMSVETYGKLLDSVQLEQLEERIKSLEQRGDFANE